MSWSMGGSMWSGRHDRLRHMHSGCERLRGRRRRGLRWRCGSSRGGGGGVMRVALLVHHVDLHHVVERRLRRRVVLHMGRVGVLRGGHGKERRAGGQSGGEGMRRRRRGRPWRKQRGISLRDTGWSHGNRKMEVLGGNAAVETTVTPEEPTQRELR